MSKRGSDYEQIVGAVSRALDPGAEVLVSTWIVGPDGRRDMDVSVRGAKDGKPYFALIECKDWKNPVGVGVVDALDSKRRDISADMAAIYSNSGFSKDARSKAARVGISLYSALKAGDKRVRVVLERDYHAPMHSVDTWSLTAFWQKERPAIEPFDPHALTFRGEPIVNWVSQKSSKLLTDHPGRPLIQAEYGFREELEFQMGAERAYLVGIVLRLWCSTSWRKQTVREDVSLGHYDLLRRRIVIPDQQALSVGPFDRTAWEASEGPPEDEPMEPNSIRMHITLLRPIGSVAGSGTPKLDDHVLESAITFPSDAA